MGTMVNFNCGMTALSTWASAAIGISPVAGFALKRYLHFLRSHRLLYAFDIDLGYARVDDLDSCSLALGRGRLADLRRSLASAAFRL